MRQMMWLILRFELLCAVEPMYEVAATPQPRPGSPCGSRFVALCSGAESVSPRANWPRVNVWLLIGTPNVQSDGIITEFEKSTF